MIDQTESLEIRAARSRLEWHEALKASAEKVLAADYASISDRLAAQARMNDCNRQIERIKATLASLGVEA